MYAIQANNMEVVDVVAEAEMDLALHTDTYLPVQVRVPFDQTFI